MELNSSWEPDSVWAGLESNNEADDNVRCIENMRLSVSQYQPPPAELTARQIVVIVTKL